MNIRDAVVVITGGSKGLGKALVNEFLDRGAQVVVGSRTNPQASTPRNSRCTHVATDVRSAEQVQRLADATVQLHGRIDIWINNAGVRLPSTPLEETDWLRVHDMMEVNLFGTMYGATSALHQMRTQASGIIVNVLSTSALEGRAGRSGYCASKTAAMGFVRCLRLEAQQQIRVVAIYPGGMQTSFFDEQKPAHYSSYMDPSVVAKIVVENLACDQIQEDITIQNS